MSCDLYKYIRLWWNQDTQTKQNGVSCRVK